MKECVYMVVI